MKHVLRSAKAWWLIISVMVIGITVNSFMALNTIDSMASIEKQIENTDNIVDAINQLHVAILTVESGQRGFILTEEEDYLLHYREDLNLVSGKIDRVAGLSSAVPSQQLLIDQIVLLASDKLNEMVTTVEYAALGDFETALGLIKTSEGLRLYDKIVAVFDAITLNEAVAQKNHRLELNQIIKESRFNFIVSSLVVTLLVVSLFILIYLASRESLVHQHALQKANDELEEKVILRTQAIQVYSDELSRSNRELEDFAFVASHDLQEPLRKIRAFGDRLNNGYADVIDERGQDFLRRMLNAAERMSALISDLLEFSRVSTRGKAFKQTDLTEVVNGVLDDLEIAIEEKQATINCGELPSLQADPSQMGQLFLNMISNALKFQRPDVKPYISVYATKVLEAEYPERELLEDLEYFDIVVEDNGIGFEQEYEDKIFSPFQRLHGRTEYDGTGIGLAVCRRIIERHNGRVRAVGKPGAGSKFIITLPTDGTPFGQQDLTD